MVLYELREVIKENKENGDLEIGGNLNTTSLKKLSK